MLVLSVRAEEPARKHKLYEPRIRKVESTLPSAFRYVFSHSPY